MPLFSIPLSGLTASSNALTVVSNNLANLNTDGFKDQTVSFADLFYQVGVAGGSGNPLQMGRGVKVAATSADFSDGSLNPTGVTTDMALQGNGFFVTQSNLGTHYTRSGHFDVNKQGQLMTPNGELVLGYPATRGVVQTGAGLQPIQLGGNVTCPAVATTQMRLNSNLSSDTAIGDSYNTPLTVYDSLGSSHVLMFKFTKTAANAWTYSVSIPQADLANPAANPVVATGNMTFGTSGNLLTPAANVANIAIAGLADGAADLSVTWQLYDNAGNGNIQQLATTSATGSSYQDGSSSGTLRKFEVDSAGVISGTFTNGQVLALGQVAVASFANVQGLNRLGNNSYEESLSSGAAVIGTAGSGGRGTIAGGALELSNVDVATEFSKMIIAQRGYQANAKVITTFDEVAQDTINLKR